jgi:hypothetical protein
MGCDSPVWDIKGEDMWDKLNNTIKKQSDKYRMEDRGKNARRLALVSSKSSVYGKKWGECYRLKETKEM